MRSVFVSLPFHSIHCSLKMAPKRHGELLARVNFPPYAVRMLSSRYVLVAGGGGKSKSGIANAIEIYELNYNGVKCCARPASRFVIGDSACMNCVAWFNGKSHMLAAGLDGMCQIYQLDYTIDDCLEKIDQSASREAGQASSDVHQRRKSSTTGSSSENAKAGKKRKSSKQDDKADQNSNCFVSRIGFDFHPGDSIQTDFPTKEEPYQKVVRVSPDLKFLVTGGSDGHVRVWEFPSLKKVLDIEAHNDDVDDLDIHPIGNKVVSVSRDGHAYIWAMGDGKKVLELKWNANSSQKYRCRNCRFAISEGKKDMSKLFTAHVPVSKQKNAPLCYLVKWDTSKYLPEKLQSVGKDLSALAVSDDGRFAAIGTMGGSIAIYIAFSLQRIYYIPEAHSNFVTGLEFLPSSEETVSSVGNQDSSLISISVDNQIKIHHIPPTATISIGIFLFIMFILLFFTFTMMSYLGL